MKVFLDTNVLVSAVITRGLCQDLLRTVLEEHDAVVSQLVLDEFVRVLRDKLGATQPSLEKALMLLDDVEVTTNPTVALDTGTLEANDATILAAAVEAQVDLFVTGDQALLAAAGKIAIPVVSPRRFMELLRTPADGYPRPPEEGEGPKVSDPLPDAAKDAAFDFALKIIELYRSLDNREDGWLAADLLREGTEIGAVLAGASAADTPRQILDAMSSALDLARSTEYRLRLLAESEVAAESGITPLLQNCRHLVCLLQTTTDPDAINYQARGGGR